MTDIYDSPWKDILDKFFQSFMEFFLSELAEEIDWLRKYESLDKELSKIMRDHAVGKRTVDKLMKVWCKSGKEMWLLIHIEVQAQAQTGFPERFYIYNYRLFDKHDKPIVSVAVLADDDPNWRPSSYERSTWYTKIKFDFSSIKLWDYLDREQILIEHPNPFAIVVWAHLQALQTAKNPEKRFHAKLAVTRALYYRGYNKADIVHLYRFIDWVLELPKPFGLQYDQEIGHLEEEKQMRYVTSIERRGIEKGREEGRVEGFVEGGRDVLSRQIRCRFGALSSKYQQKLLSASVEQLIAWGESLMDAKTLEEVFQR